MQKPELTKLSVNMNKETTEQLRRLAYDKELTYTEVVRRAIAIMTFLDAEVRDGRKLMIVDEAANTIREVKIL